MTKTGFFKTTYFRYFSMLALLAIFIFAYPFKASAISPQEANELVQAGSAILVDVRERDEIASGMAAPAQWMPTSSIDADKQDWRDFLTSLQKEKTVILYCRSGKRAGRVVDILTKLGYKALNMGGYSDWAAAGLPIKNP